MAVVIEEMVTDTVEEPTRSSAPPSGGDTAVHGEPDYDRIDYQMARRRHRSARLWAD